MKSGEICLNECKQHAGSARPRLSPVWSWRALISLSLEQKRSGDSYRTAKAVTSAAQKESSVLRQRWALQSTELPYSSFAANSSAGDLF
jgi:hypothetical protein